MTASTSRTPRTLRQVITTRLLAGVGFIVGFAAVAVLLVGTRAPDTTPARRDLPPPTRAERLVERYDCWTGEAPVDVIPSHAVVSLPHHSPRLVSAEVGFGIWLNGDRGRLHAFCP